jgi:hypothetical protein
MSTEIIYSSTEPSRNTSPPNLTISGGFFGGKGNIKIVFLILEDRFHGIDASSKKVQISALYLTIFLLSSNQLLAPTLVVVADTVTKLLRPTVCLGRGRGHIRATTVKRATAQTDISIGH